MHKILIVDDEKPARDFIAELVTFYIPDAKVTQMEHPQKALACVQREDFDMLFLDIRMPEMTGLELLEKIHHSGKHPYTVIISAHREFDYATKGIELGVVQYITKPLYKEKIYDAIRLYLQRTKTNMLEFKVPEGVRRLEIDQILAIQATERRKVNVYTNSAIIQNVTGTLSQFYKLLPTGFRYIKRNCIVNERAIKGYNQKSREVTIDCGKQEVRFEVSRENMRALAVFLESVTAKTPSTAYH